MTENKSRLYIKLTFLVLTTMIVLSELMRLSGSFYSQKIIDLKKLNGKPNELILILTEDYNRMFSFDLNNLICNVAPLVVGLIFFAVFVQKIEFKLSYFISSLISILLYFSVFPSMITFNIISISILIGLLLIILSFALIHKGNKWAPLISYGFGILTFFYLPMLNGNYINFVIELFKILIVIVSLFLFYRFNKGYLTKNVINTHY